MAGGRGRLGVGLRVPGCLRSGPKMCSVGVGVRASWGLAEEGDG